MKLQLLELHVNLKCILFTHLLSLFGEWSNGGTPTLGSGATSCPFQGFGLKLDVKNDLILIRLLIECPTHLWSERNTSVSNCTHTLDSQTQELNSSSCSVAITLSSCNPTADSKPNLRQSQLHVCVCECV